MKFEKDDISDKTRQAALFFFVSFRVVVENRLAGRRDLDNYSKVRCMMGDMIRDQREATGRDQIEWRRQPDGARRRPVDVNTTPKNAVRI